MGIPIAGPGHEISDRSSRCWLSVLRLLTPRHIIVCGLIGVAANMFVAWGCVTWSPQQGTYSPMDIVRQGGKIEPSIGPEGELAYWYRQWGTGWTYITQSPYPYPAPSHIYRYAGWPFYSLQSRVITSGKYYTWSTMIMPRRWNLRPSVILWRGLNTDDLPKWMGAYAQRRLALVPMAWGFVGNTLLYALLLGPALLWRVARFKHWRLTHRGHPVCLACGYNLTGLSEDRPCPECGQSRPPSP